MAGVINNESDQYTDEVQILVESIENHLKQGPSSPANYTIYRVLKPLRDVKPDAYTPRLVSIGPFHRGSQHLLPMEAHKLRLLKCFLDRTSQSSLADYVREMKNIEKEARQCYSEIIPFKKDDFVRMMVVDGCFLLELIIGWEERRQDPVEPIFNEIWMPQIIRDLMLLENQLPFFVLESLYNLYIMDGAMYYFTRSFLTDFLPRSPSINPKESVPRRLFNWVKSIFHSPSESNEDWGEESQDSTSSYLQMPQVNQGGASHLLDYVRQLLVLQEPKQHEGKQPQRIHCATELKKATVKFEKSNTTLLSDITFKEGVLRIPSIHIDDLTESLLRNLIALEQSHHYEDKYVIAYAVFMDDLINTPEDVKLLQDEEIFENLINLEDVATLFNKILKEVTEPHELCFSHVYSELDSYYNDPWHKLLAKVQQHMGSLRSRYFKNTWSFISFLAAIALMGLTIAQTFAAFMYGKNGS
ncbi:putative UPF0481 protein At3g02645 [Macadamia integrifolia]|uniref:putative UPF0481 protein At3g02645 n=1 Tax=Macadamia integrifolia TaxID=60698 RepID=UPI001C4E5E89|nr:putative UPF0481 protein At3g02645 [Macadamia integrifolia]